MSWPTVVRAEADLAKAIEGEWKAAGWPLVEKFCIECHNADFQEAELDLSSMKDASSAPENMVMWNRVLQMVRFGAMPPEDAPLPTETERRQLGDAIDRSIYDNNCDLRPKSGRVTARRMNRAEYRNTIRDLFGIDFRVSDEFPSDETGGGFDNNADVLSIPPMLLEKYIEAAEKIAAEAILDPAELKAIEQERSGDGIGVVGLSKTESFYGRILPLGSFAWVEFDLAEPGKYRLRVMGGLWNDEYDQQAYAVYDKDGLPLYTGEFKKARGGDSNSVTFSRDMPAGKHFFIIAPLDKLPAGFDPNKPESLEPFADVAKLDEAAIKAGREQFGKPLVVDAETRTPDARLMVRRVAIEGPTDFSKSQYPASHWMIMRRVAESRDGKYRNVTEAAAECLKPLMEKMFRGPVDKEVVERYARLVETCTQREMSFHRGMQVALTGLLVSPQFLFRVELPEDGVKPDENGEFRLSSVQLASRLSYFLWSSTPDETLLKAAREGKLNDEKELMRQVDRMLADPKSRSLATEFASQWLGLRNLSGIQRDAERFPSFDASLLNSMSTETERLFSHLLRENRAVGELLDADYTFINSELAKFYGIPWDNGPLKDASNDGFQRVSLASSPRRGVLTHASVLTLTSYPTRTSPVQRGKWILESVLGTPPPDPPPNVPELEQVNAPEGTSVREQLAIHRENPSCASCHKVMDQLGFGFEEFDAIGQYRGDEKVDASGELPGGRKFAGGQELARILRSTESSRFALTVSERVLAFALGRELSPDDRCVTDKIVEDNKSNDYRLADLVKSVVRSRPFQYFHPDRVSVAAATTVTTEEPSK